MNRIRNDNQELLAIKLSSGIVLWLLLIWGAIPEHGRAHEYDVSETQEIPSSPELEEDFIALYDASTQYNGKATLSSFISQARPAVGVEFISTPNAIQEIVSGYATPLWFGITHADNVNMFGGFTRLIALKPGLYLFDGWLRANVSPTSHTYRRMIWVRKNGNAKVAVREMSDAKGPPAPHIRGSVRLDEGDYIELILEQYSGNTLALKEAHFGMKRISD